MKKRNIQVIDGALNCVYDIFQIEDSDFRLIFENDVDIAFIEDLENRLDWSNVSKVLTKMWGNRIPKVEAIGIHGTIFYGLLNKKQYYPSLNDEEACNPNGSLLR